MAKKPFIAIPDAVDRACYRAYCETLSIRDLQATAVRQANSGEQILETITNEVFLSRQKKEKRA